MINTKLILIEGPPGSGKSTTAWKLAAAIKNSEKKCQEFYEWSVDHPIPIGDEAHLDLVIASSITRETDLLRRWQAFAQAHHDADIVTVMESRFWQTSVMLMYIAGISKEAVFESNQRVIEAIHGLNPALIYFAIDDPGAFWARTVHIKNEEWRRSGLKVSWAEFMFRNIGSQKWFTDRGLNGEQGMPALLEEWSQVSTELFERVPFPKIKIRNPHTDWPAAMAQMRDFLDLP